MEMPPKPLAPDWPESLAEEFVAELVEIYKKALSRLRRPDTHPQEGSSDE